MRMKQLEFAILSSKRRRRTAVSTMALLLGSCIALGAMAQGAGDKPSDYFASRGSGHLIVVEKFHLGKCEQHFREHDWRRTVAECNFILRQFPNHPTALLLVSQACDQWKTGACLLDDVFERAVAINPKAPGTYVVQGIYLNRTKQYATAIQRFKTALELDPDNMNAHYNLALTYLDTSQFELANEHAQRAYALGATPPGLRHLLQKAGYWKPASPTKGSVAAPPAAPTGKSR